MDKSNAISKHQNVSLDLVKDLPLNFSANNFKNSGNKDQKSITRNLFPNPGFPNKKHSDFILENSRHGTKRKDTGSDLETSSKQELSKSRGIKRTDTELISENHPNHLPCQLRLCMKL